MTYRIQYTKAADRDLSHLPHDIRKRIILAMSEIKENPFPHCKKLQGNYTPPHYRRHSAALSVTNLQFCTNI